jgi:ribosome-binding factor A
MHVGVMRLVLEIPGARSLKDYRQVVRSIKERVHSRIRVRLAAGGEMESARARLVAGLDAAKGRLRKLVGQAVGLRHAPELRFQYDEGQDASHRVEELLHEIERDRSKP